MVDEYVASCETDPLDADPAERTWRCPSCGDGVLRAVELVSPQFIGRVLGCSTCEYHERF